MTDPDEHPPEIEWLTQTPTGEWPLTDPGVTPVNVTPAHGLVVGPDEILVVVLPQYVGMHALAEHREHFRRILGDRFVMIAGGDVQLAKVSAGDWAGRAITDRVSVETQQPTARGICTVCDRPAVFRVVNKGEWWTHAPDPATAGSMETHRVTVNPSQTRPYTDEEN